MSQGYTKGIPIDVDGTLSQNTDLLVPSQKAVKTYVDTGLATKVATTGNETIAGEKTFTSKTINNLVAIPSSQETIHEWMVNDADGVVAIKNISATDGVLEPAIVGSQPTSTQGALRMISETVSDANTSAVMVFTSRLSSLAVITTRSLFRWLNHTTQVMRIMPSGSLIVGTAGDTNLKCLIEGDLGLSATSPAQITSDQNNYSTSNISNLRLTTDASRNITGFANGVAGKFLNIHNVGSFNIVLNHQNASSTAANRMILGSAAASVTIAPNDSVQLQYDSTTARWRLIGKSF